MRILFVEDHALFAQQIQPLLWKVDGVLFVKHVKSESSALQALEEDFFDLIILDLRIPASDDGLSADKENGQQVFYKAISQCPGIQIFILTGSEMDDFTKRLARYGEKTDLWGSGLQINTLDYFEKEKTDKLFQEIKGVALEIKLLQNVSLNTRGRNLELSASFERVLRVAARRIGGGSIDIVPLSGGLSKARVLRAWDKTGLGGLRGHGRSRT